MAAAAPLLRIVLGTTSLLAWQLRCLFRLWLSMTLNANGPALAVGENVLAHISARRLALRLIVAARAVEFAPQPLARSLFGRAPGMAHRFSVFAVARSLALW